LLPCAKTKLFISFVTKEGEKNGFCRYFEKLGIIFASLDTTEISMRRFFALLPLLLIFSSYSLMAGITDVIAAMKVGDAAKLANFFDNSVEITTPERSSSYSKSQAQMVVKDFFATNTVKGFDVVHQGENDGSEYCIGTLQTANGDFRTTIFMKQKDGVQVVQELRFENK
jgi:uncharacterized protein DUF4783